MVISLIARATLTHEGSVVPAGTRFDATPIAAAVLRYQRLAEFAPPGFTDLSTLPPLVPDVVPDGVTASEKPKRRYRRKDETAEPESDAPPSRRTRRTYRRRDVTSEPT